MLYGLALTLPVTILLCLGMSEGYSDLDILDPHHKRTLPLRPLLAMGALLIFSSVAIYFLT